MFEIMHKGFIARLSIHGNLIRGEIRDTHEPLIIEGQSVAELNKEFASKIEDYCSLCERRGISPFNTPDGKSSVEAIAETGWAANAFIGASQQPPEWPHKHSNFYSSKSFRLQDQIEPLQKAAGKIPQRLRLPIDDVVQGLRERTRSPSLLEGWRKPAHSKELPWFIRHWLSEAFRRVAHADPRNAEYRRDFAFEFLEHGRRLDKEATEFLRRYGGVGIPTFSRGLDRHKSAEHFQIAELAERGLGIFLERLHQLMSWAHADLDDLLPAYGGRPRLSWKYDFVAAVADLWWQLTGKRPSSKPDSQFIEFVDAAWRSGGDDMPSESWERTVRGFCEGKKAYKTCHSKK